MSSMIIDGKPHLGLLHGFLSTYIFNSFSRIKLINCLAKSVKHRVNLHILLDVEHAGLEILLQYKYV